MKNTSLCSDYLNTPQLIPAEQSTIKSSGGLEAVFSKQHTQDGIMTGWLGSSCQLIALTKPPC
ncbi:hypothetical protein M0C34_15250 [Agarivorans sp. TSD2052]|uniref:hypothetical protein n=1 Tax=Agarivorans sp. TSD2052 TaxID=2937286 RepID=UPI00200BBBF6|nr:hypothetical protein [Agarivorans sp. TSD2052]UPW17585.1 hypothetical protein M0C34_15250 [Agarivorans sp. TSD2052]